MLIPIGLLLDLLGAMMLAAVEITFFRKRMEPKELREGLNALFEQPHELKKGDEGFEGIIDVIDQKKIPIAPYDWTDSVEQLTKPHQHTGLEKIIAGRPPSEGVEVTEASVLRQWVENEIDHRIGKTYRLVGAFLLLIGFSLQFLGYLLE